MTVVKTSHINEHVPDSGVRHCSPAIVSSRLVYMEWVGDNCAGRGGRGGMLGARALPCCVVGWPVLRLSWRSWGDSPTQRYDFGDAKRGRAEVCPHSAVNEQAECSTTARSASGPYHVAARRGRLALPCGYAERGALGECTLVLARRSASLPWWRLSIIVNKNASNEQNDDKIVTVLNKFSYYAKGREAAEEAQKAIAERAKVKVDG